MKRIAVIAGAVIMAVAMTLVVAVQTQKDNEPTSQKFQRLINTWEKRLEAQKGNETARQEIQEIINMMQEAKVQTEHIEEGLYEGSVPVESERTLREGYLKIERRSREVERAYDRAYLQSQ
ncbi:MAG: hypothetical protein FWG52_08920 [Proteobacteria bacterium]|jgi:hypothetical protein|nr:hypothetical protein [Pseudomonadota bacterium]